MGLSSEPALLPGLLRADGQGALPVTVSQTQYPTPIAITVQNGHDSQQVKKSRVVNVGLLCPELVAELELGKLELHELGELAGVVPGEGRSVAAPRRAVAVGHASPAASKVPTPQTCCVKGAEWQRNVLDAVNEKWLRAVALALVVDNNVRRMTLKNDDEGIDTVRTMVELIRLEGHLDSCRGGVVVALG